MDDACSVAETLMARLDLLLADETRRAVLEDGLPADAARDAPRPMRVLRRDEVPFRSDLGDDRNDLRAQRWGIVAPVGPEGDRLLAAVDPIRRLREAEQGAPARVYRVDPTMDLDACTRWKEEVYYAEDVPVDERPLYLLVLGDLHQVPLDLQQALAAGSLVGRLAFTHPDGTADPDGYAAYASKVERHAARVADQAPGLHLYTAQDGSEATTLGGDLLVRPCRQEAERLLAKGSLSVSAVRELSDAGALRRAAEETSPAVLLSVSHGLGISTSPDARLARQGALVLDASTVLDAREVGAGRFLPGGAWFCLACFSAGTPSTSAYHAWLSRLAAASGQAGVVDSVLQTLPGPGERPFIAALPQAALASPEGPLAFIGHVDLAWCYSFTSGSGFSASRGSRILSTLRAMADGRRAGVALDALMHFYREANEALTADYQAAEAARALGRPDRSDPIAVAHRWMLRNDLRGYLLLGDPAARLSVPSRSAG
jgi:hypothetical protein